MRTFVVITAAAAVKIYFPELDLELSAGIPSWFVIAIFFVVIVQDIGEIFK